MNKRVKRTWIRALLSGEYTQGTGHLLCDGRHCCLGVLCELARAAGVRVSKVLVPGTLTNQYAFGQQRNFLPPAVVKWAGLPDKYANIPSSCKLGLADRNDGGWSFKRIAKLIEKEF
jgi:hypothetical protein